MRDLTTLYTEWRAEQGFYPHNEYSMTDRLMFQCFKGGLVTGINGAMLEMKETSVRRAVEEETLKRLSQIVISGRN